MRLRVVSDLHVEFQRDGGQTLIEEVASDPSYDVLVCAGDLADAANLEAALEFLVQAASPRPVVFVLGNHEHYGARREKVHASVAKVASKSGGQLHWLNNSSTEIGGQRFLGGTLWFPRSSTAPKHALNDFRTIPGFESWVYDEHQATVDFLRREVVKSDVVVTHHLPSWGSVHLRFVGSGINHFFVYDLEDLIAERQPRVWIHGHTHNSFRYSVGQTKILCNPFGYARFEENQAFDPKLCIEV